MVLRDQVAAAAEVLFVLLVKGKTTKKLRAMYRLRKLGCDELLRETCGTPLA